MTRLGVNRREPVDFTVQGSDGGRPVSISRPGNHEAVDAGLSCKVVDATLVLDIRDVKCQSLSPRQCVLSGGNVVRRNHSRFAPDCGHAALRIGCRVIRRQAFSWRGSE